MTRSIISDTVGSIDTRYIEEAENFRCNQRKKRTKLSPKRALALIAAIMAGVTLSVTALAAAEVGYAYDLLYMLSPTVAQALKPVNMSCEDNGIRFEVVSANIENSEAAIFIAVQDLTGDRIDATAELHDSYSINTPFACSSWCSFSSYDASSGTAMFLIHISNWDEKNIEGDKITFRVRELLSGKQKFDGPLPELDMSLLQSAHATQIPARIFGGGGIQFEKHLENFTALVPDGTDFTPVDGVMITAMGFVDGKLRIQIQYDKENYTDNHGSVYFLDADGNKIHPEASLTYFMDSELRDEYTEYIYDLSAEELAGLEAWGAFETCDTRISGSWSVTFPLRLFSYPY